MKKFYLLTLCVLCAAILGCHRHKAPNPAVQIPDVVDPDRVLYEKAMKDLSRQRFNVARLTLQTLVNTYPDSDYLQKAKFALAKSYYNEGTISALTQAEAEFRDFITFFPVADEAADAQYMIAMTHVKQIEQPDRDPSQAQFAEVELKKFIQDYPESSKLPEVKARLRGVEEILAEGNFRIGNEYFVTKNYLAAVDRYNEVLKRYPDYSKTADAIFFMAESENRINQIQANYPTLRDVAAVHRERAVILYSELLEQHPLSLYEKDAKARLTALNAPIPEPNSIALARAQQMKPANSMGLIGHMWDFMKPRPDVTSDDVPKIVTDSENAAQPAPAPAEDAPKADPQPPSQPGAVDVNSTVAKPPAKNPQ